MPGSSENGSTSDTRMQAQSPDAEEATAPTDNSSVPKPKRLACMICRKRKLRCDGLKPSCSTCARLNHPCAYDERRRKSGPKRGYVKALEERLKQVETLLKSQDAPPSNTSPTNGMGSLSLSGGRNSQTQPTPGLSVANPSIGMGGEHDMDRWQRISGESPRQATMDDFNFNANMGMGMNGVGADFTWEMIGLGLEEPLPPQDTIDELHQIYFEKVHPSMPMIHRYRYLAAMNLPPNNRPPVCLRYAMWTLACSITDKYSGLKDLFYQRARKYVEADYVKGFGEHMISVAHCQTHILLACYEMKMMYFPRAWINTGSAVRLAQMIGLHRLDGQGLDVKQSLPPPKDWTEREERRRTFWMAFCEDRYASIGTGWPMTIDERDIMTKLPSSEEAFDMSRPEHTQTLQDCTGPSGIAKLSSFGGVVLLACLFGRNLVHLHRPDDDDLDHDLNGPFWKRHRQMDNILLNISLGLPSHLKLPAGLSNPNIVFTNMSIHTSTICLHQAAIFKAEKNKLPSSVSSESKVRCITAANEIASIMRTISHMDLSSMNPFISFCLYVSARVFVQYLKSRPDDAQTVDSLRFLLNAMNALKRRNPLTESFLAQLDVDFEALAARIPKLRDAFPRPNDSAAFGDVGVKTAATGCEPDTMAGILGHRDHCHFSEMAGNDGTTGPRQEMTDSPHERPTGSRTGAPVTNGYGTQTWLGAEQPSMPVLTPNSETLYDKPGPVGGMGYGDGDGERGDKSMSPSCRGTVPPPMSSSGHGKLGNMGGAGQDQFRRSPISPGQAMINPGQGESSSHRPYFNDAGTFGIDPAMGAQQGGFSMPEPDTWGAVHGPSTQQSQQQQQPPQGDMAQVGDGVLRVLMNMGPMDAMDLSSWNTGNEHLRP